MDLTYELLDQLEWHWQSQLRPRLEGLTNEEYFWEPVPGWNLRPRGTTAPVRHEGYLQAGRGALVMDYAWPEPVPAPVTTIAWRLAHLLEGVFSLRITSHFEDGERLSFGDYDYPVTAADALDQLDGKYAQWVAGVRSWSADDLAVAVGDKEPHFEDRSRATLVLHIHREVIHHGAEIALLRDLWANGLR